MKILACAWVLLLPAAIGEAGPRQDTAAAPEQQREDLIKLIDKARNGRAVIRPQAASRLAGKGIEGGRALLAVAGDSTQDFAALGKDLVEVAGAFGLEELRTKLWSALADEDFPWRASAAIGLNSHPQAEELPHFVELLEDPLAAVRNAAVEALGTLDSKSTSARLAQLITKEEDDRVRRSIAALLDRWGERWALWYLVSDLQRVDQFFGQPTGQMARLRSYPILVERIGAEDLGFQPVKQPQDPDNAAALKRVVEAVTAVAGPKIEMPAVAAPQPVAQGELLGLELRSCRKGEFFLRWTDQDELLVGRGSSARVALSSGTSQRLTDLTAKLSVGLEGKRFWGVPGCDQETFHMRSGAEKVDVVLVSKGPAPVPDLRPGVLSEFAQALLLSLPAGPSEDARLDRLRTRVADCLEAIGGSVSGE